MMARLSTLIYLLPLLLPVAPVVSQNTCVVEPSSSGGDDGPAILKAFEECGQGGTIQFLNTTYNIDTVMNTTGLKNCLVDLQGTLLWGTNITYWLDNSMPINYQNQSSVWFFGGHNVTFDGHGFGTLNGNGQVWYDFVKGVSNFPRRPMAITFTGMEDSFVTGLRFVQSQMWTMAIVNSSNTLLQDIFVSSTTSSSNPARNTDGCDTIFSDHIHMDRWQVVNGDDSIALKANSTNILITNSTFHNGLGVAIGSIGQYLGVFETVQNVTATNITCVNTLHAGYMKTWTGEQVGFPPNGGGGGLGIATNITFSNYILNGTTSEPFAISQCTTFSGTAGNCSSSLFQIEDISFVNITGQSEITDLASLQCSAERPCSGITIEGISVSAPGGSQATGYLCSEVVGEIGFNCTGSACVDPSATGSC